MTIARYRIDNEKKKRDASFSIEFLIKVAIFFVGPSADALSRRLSVCRHLKTDTNLHFIFLVDLPSGTGFVINVSAFDVANAGFTLIIYY